MALLQRPFFEGRPSVLFPALDGLLVSLIGPTHRLLQTQPQLPNQAADVRRVVEDPELPADHFGYLRTRPYLSPKAVSLSSPLQELGHLGALLLAQAGRRSGRRLVPQAFHTFLSGTLHPLANCPFGYSQGVGYLFQFAAPLL